MLTGSSDYLELSVRHLFSSMKPYWSQGQAMLVAMVDVVLLTWGLYELMNSRPPLLSFLFDRK